MSCLLQGISNCNIIVLNNYDRNVSKYHISLITIRFTHTYRMLHTCSAQRIPKTHDKAAESISLSVNTYPMIQVICVNGRYKVEVHKNVLC